MTQIRKCSCSNVMQDKLHGAGRRVMNKTAQSGVWRCTVCEKTSSGLDKKKGR